MSNTGSTVTHQIGNTRITLHSPSKVLEMTAEQQREHFRKLQAEGDPVVTRIAETVTRILMKQAGA